MNAPVANLSVCVGDKIVVIKIAGRASFTSSVDFKALVNRLWKKGHEHFILDLTECLLMDSTFLGVLAGLGLKFEKQTEDGASIELLHPNDRISDLLENLGVAHLFTVLKGEGPEVERMAPVVRSKGPTDSKEISRTCLEAHKTLMKIHPANVDRFKDVAQFLAEDLEK